MQKNPQKLQSYLKAAEKHLKDNNYKFNVLKTVILSNSDYDFKIYNQSIRSYKNFDYLGITFSINGIDSKAHINRLYKKMCYLKSLNIFFFIDV